MAGPPAGPGASGYDASSRGNRDGARDAGKADPAGAFAGPGLSSVGVHRMRAVSAWLQRLARSGGTWVLAVLLLAAATVHAQSRWAPFEAPWFDRLDVAGGLPHSITTALAQDRNGLMWIGTMGGFLGGLGSTGPLLVGVYVAPGHRGRSAGVADALLDAIEDWARTHGSTLSLHVHEDNARAIAFYERRGFTFTGVSAPYDLAPSRLELEMRRTLAPTPDGWPTRLA